VVCFVDLVLTLTTELLSSAGDRLAQLAMASVHLGASRARDRLAFKADLPPKCGTFPAQAGQVGIATQHLPLLVREIFGRVRVPLPTHLGHRANQLSLWWAEKNNALDVSVDEVVVIILLEDLCSRVTEDTVSLLVREYTKVVSTSVRELDFVRWVAHDWLYWLSTAERYNGRWRYLSPRPFQAASEECYWYHTSSASPNGPAGRTECSRCVAEIACSTSRLSREWRASTTVQERAAEG
jgi:hypothetical protein